MVHGCADRDVLGRLGCTPSTAEADTLPEGRDRRAYEGIVQNCRVPQRCPETRSCLGKLSASGARVATLCCSQAANRSVHEVLQRLRPWQAAAALTGIALIVQVLLLAGEPHEQGVEELPPLSAQPMETAVTGLWLVFLSPFYGWCSRPSPG